MKTITYNGRDYEVIREVGDDEFSSVHAVNMENNGVIRYLRLFFWHTEVHSWSTQTDCMISSDVLDDMVKWRDRRGSTPVC